MLTTCPAPWPPAWAPSASATRRKRYKTWWWPLCSLRAWPVDELALVLRRNPEVVRQNYLRPLMRDGRLVMTRPEEPNDPQQAYRAVEGNR